MTARQQTDPATRDHRVSARLDGPLFVALRASGLQVAEAIRRGIEGTGDHARHVAAEHRLALVETRLALVEAKLHEPVDLGLAADHGKTPEEAHAEFEARRAARLAGQYAELWRKSRTGPGERLTVTLTDAGEILGATRDQAKQVIGWAVANGYATRHPTEPGRAYTWTVYGPDDPQRPGAASPAPGPLDPYALGRITEA